ncbi:MAG TPA: DMT family transporter [Anaerolineales bacterium]|nr:DMT family transporter [Anaerolineales bacterium]
MRKISLIAFFVNTLLYATYYPVAKGALERLDPWVFMALAEALTVPVALVLLVRAGRLDRQTLRSGVLLGAISNLGFAIGLQALAFTSATNTTFLGALSGVLGALITRLVLRQPLNPLTWLAGGLSLVGALGLIFEGGWAGVNLGDLIALLAAFAYAWSIFQTDRETSRQGIHTPSLLAVVLLTGAALALVESLVFGDWAGTLQRATPLLDATTLGYVAVVTTVIPYAVTLKLQRHLRPVTVAFIYVIEPLWAALFAALYLGETLTVFGLGSAGLILAGSLLAVRATAPPTESAPAPKPQPKYA